jgi:hypothetical protein
MSDATTCEAKQISLNQAQRDLESCLSPEARTQMRVDNESSRLGRLQDEADALWKMDVTVLTVLEREHLGGGTAGASDIVRGQVTSVQDQIDDAKAQIRRERRLFLDASPSVSPAVSGLYFTRTPDNQLLILFIVGYCGFLAVLSALLLVGAIPGEYIAAFTMGDRVKTVAILWGAGLLLAYLVLFVFT